MKRASVVITALAALGFCVQANATPITWDVSGYATGSFVYDASTNTYSDISVVSTGGDNLLYQDELLSDNMNLNMQRFLPIPTFLSLDFLDPLTDAGGTIDYTGQAGIGFDFFGFVTSRGEGTVASVPEPSTLALLGIGLAGLGWMGRRRKNT